MLEQPRDAWKIREPHEPEVVEKEPRKRLSEWDRFDAGRLLALFPIYGFSLLALHFILRYFDEADAATGRSGSEDPASWLVLGVLWAALGAVLAAMLVLSLLRKGARKPPVPQLVFVAYVVFTILLLPTSLRASQSFTNLRFTDFERFILTFFVTLALLLFGLVSLHGRFLGRGYGLIAMVLGILIGFVALFLAVQITDNLLIMGG